MNAIIHEKHEARVLTHEAIEVHLLYLRSGLDAVQTALPVLRDKMDHLSASVDAKIDKLSASVDAKIDKLSASMDAKIDKTNLRIDALTEKIEERFEKTDARIDKLGDKVSKVADGVAKIHGYHKTLVWVLSLAGTGAAVVSIARTLGWI
jgi:hypothetical protein